MANPNMADTAMMYMRLQAGMSSDYDTAFYHHERAEAGLMRQYRDMPFETQVQKEQLMTFQQQAHRTVLERQGNTNYDLYHPTVVHSPNTRNLFNNMWRQKIPLPPPGD